MDDERPRPPAGSISEATENKSGVEPKQLVLWSPAQWTNSEADKARPTRALGQRAESKFLLMEPIVAGAASPGDHEIRPPRRDEVTVSDSSVHAQWLLPALIIGALAAGVALGWIGGSSRFFATAPASTPVRQADASGCVREGGKETGCAAAKSDREAMASGPSTAKIAGPRARMVNRGHESSRGTQQASAAANRDVLTTNSITPASIQDRAKILPRPTAVPETRPTTIEGWTIREVVGGTAVLEGPGGVWRVTQGDTVPGVGRIDSIVRWGSRWIVATTRGLISTQD
jgi:hypothetical protein